MSGHGTKHTYLRYKWQEQIIADGLYDLVGVAHAIAQRDFCITIEQLATTLRVSVATAERLVKKLTDRGHLKKISGKSGRVPNKYEPALFNPLKNEGVDGSEMRGQPRQNRGGNPLKSEGSTPSEMRDPSPKDSQESSQVSRSDDDDDRSASAPRAYVDEWSFNGKSSSSPIPPWLKELGIDRKTWIKLQRIGPERGKDIIEEAMARVENPKAFSKYVSKCIDNEQDPQANRPPREREASSNTYAGNQEPRPRYRYEFRCSKCTVFLGGGEDTEGPGVGYIPCKECGYTPVGGKDVNTLVWIDEPPWERRKREADSYDDNPF